MSFLVTRTEMIRNTGDPINPTDNPIVDRCGTREDQGWAVRQIVPLSKSTVIIVFERPQS